MEKLSNEESNLIDLFGKHFVALCITFESVDENGHRIEACRAFSCMLMTVSGITFLLTAGHIIKSIEESKSDSAIRITGATLADTFGADRISDEPIPFDLLAAKMFSVVDNHDLDFGLIALDYYYVRLLDANGLISLFEKNWNRPHTVHFDLFLLLGLPEVFTEKSDIVENGIELVPTIIKLSEIEQPDEEIREFVKGRFCGKILGDLPIDSIVGMSGGPIFGVSFAEPMRYWIVALQSTWLKQKRIIFGCPMPKIGNLMKRAMGGYSAESND